MPTSTQTVARAVETQGSLNAATERGFLQRKCDCGNHTMGGDCSDCAKEKGVLQRRSDSEFESPVAPPIVSEVLHSSGQPLDPRTRSTLEHRLGSILGKTSVTPIAALPQRMAISQPDDAYEREADSIADQAMSPGHGARERDSQQAGLRYDLSQVRVHTDARAADSARAVRALAYTVGDHIVFGSGYYAPQTAQGLRLLTHEVAHTAQQKPVVARKAAAGTCLGPDACKEVKFPSTLLKEGKDESKARRESRKKLCGKTPPDPGCRADGHADRAVETEKLLLAYDASRLAFAKGIFVDRDLEKDFRALTTNCNAFTPPISTTGICITVPIETEQESKEFNTTSGPREIDGKSRDEWRAKMLEILVHEAEHTRFRTIQIPRSTLVSGGAPTLLGKPRPTCSKDPDRQNDVFSAMNELGSMLQEFPMRKAYIRSNVALSKADKDTEIEEWRDHRVRGTTQSITVSLRTARCLCGCDDANDLIRETIKFATSTWSLQEVDELDREMTDDRWSAMNLDWPSKRPPKGDFPQRVMREGEEVV